VPDGPQGKQQKSLSGGRHCEWIPFPSSTSTLLTHCFDLELLLVGLTRNLGGKNNATNIYLSPPICSARSQLDSRFRLEPSCIKLNEETHVIASESISTMKPDCQHLLLWWWALAVPKWLAPYNGLVAVGLHSGMAPKFVSKCDSWIECLAEVQLSTISWPTMPKLESRHKLNHPNQRRSRTSIH
jgi:hypothetical protein